MKTLSIFMFGAFGAIGLIDLCTGKYYVGILELLIAVHSLSDYYGYAKEAE